jgi:hypothetical protein
MLNKQKIKQGFDRLNVELSKKDIIGDIVIFGGAYMVLSLDARPTTKDVDAIFKPASEIRSLAKEIAEELNLPEDWLNDGVKGFLPTKPNEKGSKILKYSNLNIWCPKPEYILAMKCMASRVDSKDGEDIKTLIKHLNLKTKEDVLEIVVSYFPAKEVPIKVQYFIEELFE